MIKQILLVAAGVLLAQAVVSFLPADAKVIFRG